MPLYELITLCRSSYNSPRIGQYMKKTAELIWKHKGVIRRLDYLGQMNLGNKFFKIM
jgi:ribosomal protein S6